MTCFSPKIAYRSKERYAGKYIICFNAAQDFDFDQIRLPCKNCRGCRLEHSRQWAMRCVFEASLYSNNCFITLTLNNDNLPDDWSLNKKIFQKFMKRLRKKFGPKIRYYHCGEYGDEFGRPHYHACLFNHDFSDRRFFKMSRSGFPLYRSEDLESLWKFGHSTVADMSFESAAYVARYCMKKINGPSSFEHYVNYVDLSTGEYVLRQREYSTMSRRPGIANAWYEANKSDVYPKDSVSLRGKVFRPPAYFDRLFEHEYPDDYELLKKKRSINVYKQETLARLKVIEEVKRLNDLHFRGRDRDL